MNVKKVGKITAGILGGLLVFIILTLLFWLGPTVRLIAQTLGPKALGTELTINSLSINPRKGTIHLSDFAIANPETFGQSNVVSLSSLDIALDMGSIFTKTVVVHQVSINSPHFIYEQGVATDNIQEFIVNIQEFIGFDPNTSAHTLDSKQLEKERKKKEKKAEKGKAPKVVVIESLSINDVQFHLANTDDELLDFNLGFEQLFVSMTNGTVQMDNFYVSNPSRLETQNLFSLEQFEILLEPESAYSSNVIVHAVNIRKPHAFVEHNPETDSVGEFLKIASKLIAKIPTNVPSMTATNDVILAKADQKSATPKEIILETVTIDDVQFHVVNIGDPKLSVYLGLEQLAVAMNHGEISLNNLFLTNPSRLILPHLFSLEDIAVNLDPNSLKSDTVIIRDVKIKKPSAFLELNTEANTVGEFMKIATGFTERIPVYAIPSIPSFATDTSKLRAHESAVATAEPSVPPIELHNLLVDDIKVHLLDATPTNNIPSESHILASIGEISIRLVDGKLQVNEITVPNMPGFLATNLFHLANIDISVEPDSIFSDQVVIQEIFINTPVVNLEQTEESGNVADLQATLTQLTPADGVQSNAAPAEKSVVSPPEPTNNPVLLADQPIILQQLFITNLAVNLKLPVSTNTTLMGSITDLSNLNPMGKMEILNPLSNEKETEDEIDPDAPVTLLGFDLLSLEPLKGLLNITNLRIANPPNFSRRDLMNIEEFRIDLDPDSIQTDTLLIKDILISRPRIRYERKLMIDNIKALQKEIEQATTPAEAEEKDITEAQATEETEEDGQKVIIDHVLISSGLVSAKFSALPAIPVPLPNIELSDIGKEEGGASAVEASTQVFETFYESMIGAVGNSTNVPSEILNGVYSSGTNSLNGVIKEIETTVIDPNQAITDGIDTNKKRRWKRRGIPGRHGTIR